MRADNAIRVIVRVMRKRAFPAIILAYAAGASSCGTVSIIAIDYYYHLTGCHPSSKVNKYFFCGQSSSLEMRLRRSGKLRRPTFLVGSTDKLPFLRSDDHLGPSG